jgi:hypothetical protein
MTVTLYNLSLYVFLARTHKEKHNVKSVVTPPGEGTLMQTERCLMIDTLR